MNKQIECLEKSINEKWIPIVNGEKAENSGEDCACCQVFEGCHGCPIANDIGDNCGNNFEFLGEVKQSAYWAFHNLYYDAGLVSKGWFNYDLMFEVKAAAQMELDYLIALKEKLEKT